MQSKSPRSAIILQIPDLMIQQIHTITRDDAKGLVQRQYPIDSTIWLWHYPPLPQDGGIGFESTQLPVNDMPNEPDAKHKYFVRLGEECKLTVFAASLVTNGWLVKRQASAVRPSQDPERVPAVMVMTMSVDGRQIWTVFELDSVATRHVVEEKTSEEGGTLLNWFFQGYAKSLRGIYNENIEKLKNLLG